MNEELNMFIKSLGALSEVWAITYKNFLRQGFDEETALIHTQAFVAMILSAGDLGDVKSDKEE